MAARLRRQLQNSAASLLGELAQLRWNGPRAVLCAQTVGAVVLAVGLADAFALEDRWWVALSAYAVLRNDFAVSARRCLERLGGTMIGAAIGVAAVWLLPASTVMQALVLGLVAGVGLYRSIGSPHAYSWILGTVTALMVLSEAHAVPDVRQLAVLRVADVGVGVGSALAMATLVSLLRSMRFRRRAGAAIQALPPAPAATAATASQDGRTIRRLRGLQSLQGGITLFGFGLLAGRHLLPHFVQALISVVAVLVVPLPALLHGEGGHIVVSRMLNRMIGCLFAALVAVLLLPVVGSVPVLCLLTLAAGVWLAAHVQSGSEATSYIGTQFGVGFIMIFVQDGHWSTDLLAPVHRLLGMMTGLAGLALVMLATAGLGRLGARYRKVGS